MRPIYLDYNATTPVDPAVVDALQKILIDREQGTPAGGVEESEPKDNAKPSQR